MANTIRYPDRADELFCSICLQYKKDDEFPRQAAKKYNRYRDTRCRSCQSATKKLPENRARARVSERRRKLVNWGTTEAQVTHMFEEQGSCCEACKRPLELWGRNMVIDHDHATGLFRGILCSSCNSFLGIVEENIERIQGLIEYKLKHTDVLAQFMVDETTQIDKENIV